MAKIKTTPFLGLTTDAETESYSVERVNVNNTKIDTFASSVDKALTEVDVKIQQIEKDILEDSQGRFDKIDATLEEIKLNTANELRFNKIDTELGQVKEALAEIRNLIDEENWEFKKNNRDADWSINYTW